MKGKITKIDEGWVVRYDVFQDDYSYPFPGWNFISLHPDDVKEINIDSQVFDNIEARIAAYPDVEFEVVEEPPYKLYAKLIKPEYPELEGTMTLCNDKIWNEIYDEYSTEQYPAFGGPFTDSISFIDWLKQNYIVPKRK